MLINRDDRVVYTGRKYSKDLAGKIGFVVAPIGNQPGGWVIDFPEHSYVMSENVLEKYRPVKDESGPEIHTRRRHKHDDEE